MAVDDGSYQREMHFIVQLLSELHADEAIGVDHSIEKRRLRLIAALLKKADGYDIDGYCYHADVETLEI